MSDTQDRATPMTGSIKKAARRAIGDAIGRQYADAALEALAKAGLALVPKTLTPEIACEAQVEAAARRLAYDAWPLAADDERAKWAQWHWQEWEVRARAAIAAAAQAGKDTDDGRHAPRINHSLDTGPADLLDSTRDHQVTAPAPLGRADDGVPSPAEIELMMEGASGYNVGSVMRDAGGTLRTYYAGFNLSLVAEYISRELANASPAPLAAAPSPPVQSGEGRDDAGAKLIAKWIGYGWDGIGEGRIADRGFPQWACNGIGSISFQGGKQDLRDLANAIADAKVKIGPRGSSDA